MITPANPDQNHVGRREDWRLAALARRYPATGHPATTTAAMRAAADLIKRLLDADPDGWLAQVMPRPGCQMDGDGSPTWTAPSGDRCRLQERRQHIPCHPACTGREEAAGQRTSAS